MDNIPGALVYTDQDLNIVFCNDRFAAMYPVPRELLQPNQPYPDFLRYLAEHEYYGEGDIEPLVAGRVESLRNPSGKAFEDRTPDGRVYRVARRRVAESGTVTVMTDITELKHAEQKLSRRFRLLGTQGLVGIALAAIDMALWDALARVHGVPLVRLLGGVEKPVRAYGAIGYDGKQGCAKAAQEWSKRGFMGIKAKIGYPTVQEDVSVIRAMREAAGIRSTAVLIC
jgi:hypothetical protein